VLSELWCGIHVNVHCSSMDRVLLQSCFLSQLTHRNCIEAHCLPLACAVTCRHPPRPSSLLVGCRGYIASYMHCRLSPWRSARFPTSTGTCRGAPAHVALVPATCVVGFNAGMVACVPHCQGPGGDKLPGTPAFTNALRSHSAQEKEASALQHFSAGTHSRFAGVVNSSHAWQGPSL
jgi:hypothetical protein